MRIGARGTNHALTWIGDGIPRRNDLAKIGLPGCGHGWRWQKHWQDHRKLWLVPAVCWCGVTPAVCFWHPLPDLGKIGFASPKCGEAVVQKALVPLCLGVVKAPVLCQHRGILPVVCMLAHSTVNVKPCWTLGAGVGWRRANAKTASASCAPKKCAAQLQGKTMVGVHAAAWCNATSAICSTCSCCKMCPREGAGLVCSALGWVAATPPCAPGRDRNSNQSCLQKTGAGTAMSRFLGPTRVPPSRRETFQAVAKSRLRHASVISRTSAFWCAPTVPS